MRHEVHERTRYELVGYITALAVVLVREVSRGADAADSIRGGLRGTGFSEGLAALHQGVERKVFKELSRHASDQYDQLSHRLALLSSTNVTFHMNLKGLPAAGRKYPLPSVDSFTHPDFAILLLAMPTDPQPSARDRRAYFRITLVLPMSIQRGDDATEGTLTEKSVNISGGGIGFIADTDHNPGDIVVITLRLDEETLLKVRAEVLKRNPLPRRPDAYRIHARFIQMSVPEREILIGHIMRVQREHLHDHYSA